MPIFHDPDPPKSPPRASSACQTLYPEHTRTETPGIVPQQRTARRQRSRSPIYRDSPCAASFRTPSELCNSSVVNRKELMDRIKRTSSPSWPQRQDVCKIADFTKQDERLHTQSFDSRPKSPSEFRERPRTPVQNVDMPEAALKPSSEQRDVAAIGMSIERPRSALHSGDFREREETDNARNGTSSSGFLATSPVVPWHRSFPVPAYASERHEPRPGKQVFSNESHAVSRARAISQSSPQSFAFLPPTSPLVNQANNTDLDQSRAGSRQNSRSPERNNRRHTFSPASFHGYQSVEMARSATGTPAARHIRYGGAVPYQAHQPRRSSTFNHLQPQSNPQSPYLHSRRPSFSSDASPLQHAPMVGSYEESILRGRMSTTPSRPLDFVAKIGVLGKGKCKANLKCPPHVTVPFPAVFYSYNTGNGRISDNEPSPYVGLIDLEHSLSAPEEGNEAMKRKRRHNPPDMENDDLDFRLQFGEEATEKLVKDDLRRKEKRKRRSTSPKAPPGGCYRIPPQGQLQIVLKNPNKTAVKLFLVPYDLSDMEPGQKTFIRQRSYSAGPIIDMPSTLRKNLGTDRPEAALSNSEDPNDRPILRYLIHLHICCPSKGRHYLYKSIRVVFANRVPDGKEKLRNEIQLPEPKYSAYRPSRDMTVPHPQSSIATNAGTERAIRRRSAGWPLSRSQQAYDQIDGLPRSEQLPPPAVQFTGGPLSTSASSGLSTPSSAIQPIPFNFTRLTAIESRPVSRDAMDVDANDPFQTPVASPKSGLGSPVGDGGQAFGKLNKGDVGYGGNAFSPVSSPTTPLSAGLLSQRLRGLDVHPDDIKRSPVLRDVK